MSKSRTDTAKSQGDELIDGLNSLSLEDQPLTDDQNSDFEKSKGNEAEGRFQMQAPLRRSERLMNSQKNDQNDQGKKIAELKNSQQLGEPNQGDYAALLERLKKVEKEKEDLKKKNEDLEEEKEKIIKQRDEAIEQLEVMGVPYIKFYEATPKMQITTDQALTMGELEQESEELSIGKERKKITVNHLTPEHQLNNTSCLNHYSLSKVKIVNGTSTKETLDENWKDSVLRYVKKTFKRVSIKPEKSEDANSKLMRPLAAYKIGTYANFFVNEAPIKGDNLDDLMAKTVFVEKVGQVLKHHDVAAGLKDSNPTQIGLLVGNFGSIVTISFKRKPRHVFFSELRGNTEEALETLIIAGLGIALKEKKDGQQNSVNFNSHDEIDQEKPFFGIPLDNVKIEFNNNVVYSGLKEITQHGEKDRPSVFKCKESGSIVKKVLKVYPYSSSGMTRAETEIGLLEKLGVNTQSIIQLEANFCTKTSTSRNYALLSPCGKSLEKLEKEEKEKINFKILIRHMMRAIECLQRNSIVHRDIKPQNIIRVLHDDNSESYYLIDFDAAMDFGTDQHEGCLSTPKFSARSVEEGRKCGIFDDYECLMYTLVHVSVGDLPWDDKPTKKKNTHCDDFKEWGKWDYFESIDNYVKEYMDCFINWSENMTLFVERVKRITTRA